jgi:glycosyltransferase involved in cell wall biosynthesis
MRASDLSATGRRRAGNAQAPGAPLAGDESRGDGVSQNSGKRLPVSLITTTYNEGASIRPFLASIAVQTSLPEEIILVDGGSTDDTVAQIEAFRTEFTGCSLELVASETRINIARGRNLAIQRARHDVIAVTDAGCVLDAGWLDRITMPLVQRREVDVVAGWYEFLVETEFDRKVAAALAIPLSQIDPDQFLPSSRSIAFRKAAWQRAGGYPEWLTLCAEDTLFDLQLKAAGCVFVFEPEAVVWWRTRPDRAALLRSFFAWGFGDGEARILPMRYLARAALLVCPPLFVFTKKRFRSVPLRYGIYAASVLGWACGIVRSAGTPLRRGGNAPLPPITHSHRMSPDADGHSPGA